MPSFLSALALIGLLFATGPAISATWRLGSGSAPPGGSFDLVISFVGDGETTDAQIDVAYDVAVLELVPPTFGEISGASIGPGSCHRVASHRIRIVIGAPQHDKPVPICRLRFSVSVHAPPRASAIQGYDALCAAPDGLRPCLVENGSTSVLSTTPTRMLPRGARPNELLAVVSPLHTGRLFPSIWRFDYRSDLPAPLPALDASRPRSVFPLMWPRAYGDYAQALDDAPHTALAVSYRTLVIGYESVYAAACGLEALRRDPAIESVEPGDAEVGRTACASVPSASSPQSVPLLGHHGRVALVLALLLLVVWHGRLTHR